MKTFRIVGFALFAILMCLSACSGGGDDPIEPTPKPEVTKSEITIDSSIISNGLSFTNEKGEQSISFSTNENWTLSVASTTSGTTWCTASATSGSKGTATVKFEVAENTTYDNRSVSVTIKSGTASKTFTISQKGVDALLVTTDKYEVSQEGGTIEIEVKANIDYKMEISETAKDWIKESSSRALTTHKHKLDIAMNEDVEKREGEIMFKSGDKVETVKIYQAGGAIILLSQNEYTVSDAGDTISVEIKSNVEFGVQMPEVDWIVDEASSRGLSSHTLKYIVNANEEYDARSASIVFYDKNSDLKDTLKVVQTQKDAIVVAKNEYTIESTGGELKFEVNTNVDFEISTSVDWIKQNTESRGLEAKPLNFTIDENTTEEAREGIITISSGDLKQEIKVLQKTKSVFSLSETEFNITSDGGEFKVEVSTNGEYTITMPEVDWLSENDNRTTSSYAHTFTALANETYDAREAEIVFTHKETEDVLKVKVVQAQKDAIVISEKNISVAKEGGAVEVKVNTNVDFEVQIPSEVTWITQTDSRALTEKNVYLRVAENTNEESRSAKITFMNENSQIDESVTIVQAGAVKAGYANGVVTIAKAGSMKSLLGSDYLNITSLKIVGPINGDDIYYLRKMLGGSNFSQADWGKLETLDLSDARIVEGGEWYYEDSSKSYYTSNNVVGDYMFYQCSKLQSLSFFNNVYKVGKDAFGGCKNLTSVYYKNLSSWYNLNFDTYLSNPLCNGGKLYINGKELTDIIVPGEISDIKPFAFYGCTSLVKVTMVDGTTAIGEKAFEKCKNLKTITLSEDVAFIDKSAFSYSGLTSINIPKGVIGESAFYECSSLLSVTIGDGVTSVGSYTFFACSALKDVKIGHGVSTIKTFLFGHCRSLSTVSLGKNVTALESSAFIDTSIRSFTCYAKEPPVFKDEYYYVLPVVENAYLCVPSRCGSKYKSSDWGNIFKNIKEMD